MLPFDRKPWAKPVARFVIIFTVIALAIFVAVIRHQRRLDVPEITFVILVLLAVIPPNIAIIRRRPDAAPTPPSAPQLDHPEPNSRVEA